MREYAVRENTQSGTPTAVSAVKQKKSNPYSGRPIHIPGGLSERIRRGFGIDTERLSIKESPEVTQLGDVAVTQGDSIRFAPGAFRAETRVGMEMLGHELFHAREQAQGRIKANVPGENIHFDSAGEQAGDRAGQAFASGGLSAANPVAVQSGGAANAPVQGFLGLGKKKKNGNFKNLDLSDFDKTREFLENLDLNEYLGSNNTGTGQSDLLGTAKNMDFKNNPDLAGSNHTESPFKDNPIENPLAKGLADNTNATPQKSTWSKIKRGFGKTLTNPLTIALAHGPGLMTNILPMISGLLNPFHIMGILASNKVARWTIKTPLLGKLMKNVSHQMITGGGKFSGIKDYHEEHKHSWNPVRRWRAFIAGQVAKNYDEGLIKDGSKAGKKLAKGVGKGLKGIKKGLTFPFKPLRWLWKEKLEDMIFPWRNKDDDDDDDDDDDYKIKESENKNSSETELEI